MGAARVRLGSNELTFLTGTCMSLLVLLAWTRTGWTGAVALGSLPLIAIGAALLLRAGRIALIVAVLGIPLAGLTALVSPLSTPGITLFPQDVIVLLALGAWAFEKLIYRRGDEALRTPKTIVFGWPLVLFSAAIIIATLRGHYEYGAPVFGQPLRLVLYAGIVVALAGVTVERLYQIVRAVLYIGTTVTMLWATYYIATGTSQTDQLDLSTGGTRVLGITTSLFCACTLFFALLSLRLSPRGSARVLHLTMATLSLFGVVLGFGRAVFAATAIASVVLIVGSRSVRNSIGTMVPLALPFLLLIAIAIPRLTPDLVDAAQKRISSPPAQDANVQWRVEANKAVFAQVREQPLIGVGFGRTSEFFIRTQSSSGLPVPVRISINQDPHNSYLYLWAGGGLLALGSFLLLLVVAAWDGVRRFSRTTDPKGRILLIWTAASLFAFLLNAATEPALTSPPYLLTIWLLLGIPALLPESSQPRVVVPSLPVRRVRTALHGVD